MSHSKDIPEDETPMYKHDEDELLPEHKEALDLHLKKSMETIPNNIELNP